MNEVLRGKTDPMFLANDVLELDFQPQPHEKLFLNFLPCDPEKPFAQIDPEIKKRMILWPRGVFKTTARRVKAVQRILCWPNSRTLFGAPSGPLGKVQLSACKRFFEFPTPKFKELYPEYCGKKLGNMSQFTVPNRTDFSSPEATVTSSTARSVKAGSHYDFVDIDDLVNDQNYKNPELLEQCWQDFLDFGPLRDPAGYLTVTGTPYTFGDTYERVEEFAMKEEKLTGKKAWSISTNTCWVEKCSRCGLTDLKHDSKETACEFKGTGEKILLFPQVTIPKRGSKDAKTIGHTREFLEEERRKDPDFFAMQYECRRLARGMQAFTDELIAAQTLFHFERPVEESETQKLARQVQQIMQQGKTFDEAVALVAQRPTSGEIPLGGWQFAIGDLAYVSLLNANAQRKRDKCVFYIVRVVNGALFVIACHSGQWKSGEVGDQIVMMMLRYQLKIIWCEAFLGHEAYDTVIKMVAVQAGLQVLPLEWLPMSNEDDAKIVRIGSIHAWLKQRKLWLFAGMDDYEVLCSNLKKYPKLGRHDDHGDCLGQVVNAPHGIGLERIAQSGNVVMAELRKIMNLIPQEENTSYPDGPCGSMLVG
jgi:hypothetical protein